LLAARPGEHGRYAFLNNKLAVHHRGGTTERRTLTSPAEMCDVLTNIFRIRLPALAVELDRALGKVISAPDTGPNEVARRASRKPMRTMFAAVRTDDVGTTHKVAL
jgi:hypothetical protein